MRLKLCFTLISLFSFIVADHDVCDENADPANDSENIERPFPNLDVDCIREYFSNNFKCQIAYGPVPDPLYLDHYRLEFPHANITAEVNYVTVGDLNGKIVEFYVNRETEKLVFALEVPALKLYSQEVTFKYNRKAKEPIVRSDIVEFDYGTVTFTAVFRTCDLDLCNADISTYIENSKPKYTIGSGLYQTSNSVAQRQFEKLINNLPIDLREGFALQGNIFMANYIQYNICDFGLESDLLEKVK